ncbi:MAG: hypothetical protein FJ110_02800 [Deltaproteobacteria bacterium]|nr:hypothetical protein [Deltaproteobacteria bacterium]
MRVTVNVPDRIIHDLKSHATRERKSVSSLVTEFIEFGMKDKRKRAAKENILQMIGKVKVNKNALKMLDKMRSEDDRA